MREIIHALPALIDELVGEQAREAIVLAILPTVLGEHLRERSAALRLDGTTLRIAVSNGEWKREFKEHAAQIVYKINRALGSPLVERIDLVINESAVGSSLNASQAGSKQDPSLLQISNDLKNASTKIGDSELRKHFIEAAALCIRKRDSK